MALSQRERNVFTLVIGAVAVLAADMLAVQPYLDRRDELVQQRTDRQQALKDARDTLTQEQRLHQLLAGMTGDLNADASTAEARLLHLVHDWEQQAALGNANFGRVRSVDEHGATRLTFEVSATGSMAGVASLIHHVESAPIPLRIDSMRVTSTQDSGQELRVDFDLSTVCQALVRADTTPRPTGIAAAAASSGGGG